MSYDSTPAISSSKDLTLEIAHKILQTTNRDPVDALIKGVGSLAQVIHALGMDFEENRESILHLLKKYLEALRA